MQERPVGGVQERGPIAGSSWPAKPLAARNTRWSEGKLSISSQPAADYRIHKTTAWSSPPLFFFFLFLTSHLLWKVTKNCCCFVFPFKLRTKQNSIIKLEINSGFFSDSSHANPLQDTELHNSLNPQKWLAGITSSNQTQRQQHCYPTTSDSWLTTFCRVSITPHPACS